MRVVSMASARGLAGWLVASRSTSLDVVAPAPQQEHVWASTPATDPALQLARRAMALDPCAHRRLSLKPQQLSVCGGGIGANRVLQAQSRELHLLQSGFADSQACGLPEMPHRLHLEPEQLGPDHVGG